MVKLQGTFPVITELVSVVNEQLSLAVTSVMLKGGTSAKHFTVILAGTPVIVGLVISLMVIFCVHSNVIVSLVVSVPQQPCTLSSSNSQTFLLYPLLVGL